MCALYVVPCAQIRVAIEVPCVSRGLLTRPLSLDMLVTLVMACMNARHCAASYELSFL